VALVVLVKERPRRKAAGDPWSGLRRLPPDFVKFLLPVGLLGIANFAPTRRELTASTTDVALPALDSFAVLSGEIYEYHAALVADPAKRALYDPATLERIVNDACVTAPQYIASRRQLQLARRRIAALFEDVDVLVTPMTMTPPVRIDAALAHAYEQATDWHRREPPPV
jgi:Asp-tRNA(Asn)/Glu-tRNA(Gln) amidotransferase A subunit family amidase